MNKRLLVIGIAVSVLGWRRDRRLRVTAGGGGSRAAAAGAGGEQAGRLS